MKAVTFKSVNKFLVTIGLKADEVLFLVVQFIILYKVVLTLSLWKLRMCESSYEIYLTMLCYATIC